MGNLLSKSIFFQIWQPVLRKSLKMQSTKEEYHFTKTFLSQQEQQQQLSAQRQQWLSPSQQLNSR